MDVLPPTTTEGKSAKSAVFPALLIFGALMAALALWWASSAGARFHEADKRNPRRRSQVPVVASLKSRLRPRVVRESEAINPHPGEDFLLFLWVKPSRMPSARSRAIALLKFDPRAPSRPGFAVALSRSAHGVRPEVYWKGNSIRGGWYSFPQFEFAPHVWTLLAISYRADRFLGLHAVPRAPAKEGQVITLGGHVVDGSAPPEAQVPIDLGAVEGGSSFRGDIGPLGIIAGQGLAEHLPRLLQAIDHQPDSPPKLPSSLRMVSFVAAGSELSEGEKDHNDKTLG